MSRRRGIDLAVLALACVALPSCGNTRGEGSRTPASGTASGTAGTSTGGGGTGPWTFSAGVTKPKIMIVGDSISAGPGCYKKFLLQDLTDNHYSNFEFVGEYSDDCGSTVRHSAVSCSTAEQYTQAMFSMPNCQVGKSLPGMSTLVVTHNPDLVMLQLGVNDVWNSKPTADILANYAKLIAQARAQNPHVALAVARIQKISPACSADDPVSKRAEELVNAVAAWAGTQSQPQSPVFVADLWTNSDWTKAETIDCVHPNDVGAEKMGMNWFNTLKNILKPD
jgi:lysophospholipase L1-like esterase